MKLRIAFANCRIAAWTHLIWKCRMLLPSHKRFTLALLAAESEYRNSLELMRGYWLNRKVQQIYQFRADGYDDAREIASHPKRQSSRNSARNLFSSAANARQNSFSSLASNPRPADSERRRSFVLFAAGGIVRRKIKPKANSSAAIFSSSAIGVTLDCWSRRSSSSGANTSSRSDGGRTRTESSRRFLSIC